MHIHLDPVGGIAGDMFLASLLHAWPELREPITSAIRKAGLPSAWSIEISSGVSGGITGTRVKIHGDKSNPSFSTGSFKDIRKKLVNSELCAAVIDRAVDIFYLLAKAESTVHGQPIDEIHFHEIADWDSIADIVGTATALQHIDACSWSVAELPIGSGIVQTAHGKMPVPAPATALLLQGYNMTDDGFFGERVTPTGAAILRHLNASQNSLRPNGCLSHIGYGLGTREIDGIPNILRLLAFEIPSTGFSLRDKIGTICFEIDDQTPEDLAVALEKLRKTDNVIDVINYAVSGKKGRIGTSVRILCHPEALESVMDVCFLQTTTIGLRWGFENRAVLKRENVFIAGLGAKRVLRPGGSFSIKANMDEIAENNHNQIERTRKRRAIEGVEDEIDC